MYDHLVQIKHYPFGRWSLYRELIEQDYRKSCSWCGSRAGKFVYYVWYDDKHRPEEPVKGDFCSKGCMATYHDFWDN